MAMWRVRLLHACHMCEQIQSAPGQHVNTQTMAISSRNPLANQHWLHWAKMLLSPEQSNTYGLCSVGCHCWSSSIHDRSMYSSVCFGGGVCLWLSLPTRHVSLSIPRLVSPREQTTTSMAGLAWLHFSPLCVCIAHEHWQIKTHAAVPVYAFANQKGVIPPFRQIDFH